MITSLATEIFDTHKRMLALATIDTEEQEQDNLWKEFECSK